MVGQNDPCPCGSGRKYKKCHGKEQTVNVQEIVERELAVINRRFIDEGMETKHIEEMIQRDKRWFPALEGIFSPDLISDLPYESYAYVEKRELWTEFVMQDLKKNHRTQVTKMLEAWLHPLWILAKVLREEAGLLEVKDELSGNVYTIENQRKNVEGDWLFGIVFCHPDAEENRLQGTSGLVFIPRKRKDLMEMVYLKLKDYDGDALGLYQSFGKANK